MKRIFFLILLAVMSTGIYAQTDDKGYKLSLIHISEGYVYEAINGASREGLPVIFVWQDNGYGISVPKKDQTCLLYTSRCV